MQGTTTTAGLGDHLLHPAAGYCALFHSPPVTRRMAPFDSSAYHQPMNRKHWKNHLEEVDKMVSLTLMKSRFLLVMALAVVTALWLLSPEAWAAIVDYIRGGGGLDLFTP